MKLTIVVSKEKGVESITARPTSVSEANTAGEISARMALPLSLLHETIVGAGTSCPTSAVESLIWVPRCEVNGKNFFDRVQLNLVRKLKPLWSHKPFPEWFREALRLNHPELTQDCTAEDIFSRSFLADFTEPGWITDPIYGLVFVAEVSDLSAEQLRAVDHFCTVGGLEHRISAGSFSWPSGRLRVEISRVLTAEDHAKLRGDD